jgi:6-phosphogluconolactonase (cycloisomerase 2 family)
MTTVRIIGICFVCTLLAGGVASSALAAGGVGTLSQHPGAEGCVTQDGTDGASGTCRVGRGFDEISMTVISPDGRFLYASSIDPANAILVFAIDQVNGALTQLAGTNGCVSDDGTDGAVGFCVDGRALGEVKHLAISPGGEHLYAAAAGADALNVGTVAVFARDAATGVLTQLAGTDGCIRQGAAGPDGCAVGRGMGEPTSVTVSPDGQNVYVTGSAGGTPEGVAVFTRAG